MENKLSDRDNWANSWSKFKPSIIPNTHFIEKYLANKNLEDKKFIEIGGFPGTMSAFFYKKYRADVKFIDFFIDESIVKSIESINGIPSNSLKYLEIDFFDYTTDEKFDLVYSSGFIEHFIDIDDVIKRHVSLLNENGELLILLPNFKGINGWIQRKFDKPSYDIHNIQSMDINYLTPIMQSFDLRNLKIEFSDKPMFWLSKQDKKFNKLIRIIVKFASYIVKLFPFKSKIISPFIVISAQK